MGIFDINVSETPASNPQPESIKLDESALDTPRQKQEIEMQGGIMPEQGVDRTQAIDQMRNQMTYDGVNAQKQDNPESLWGADYTTMSLGKKFKRSLLAGVGQVATETGDMIQFLGAALPGIDMVEGSSLSRFFQEWGEEIDMDNLVKQSPELEGLEDWSWAHLGNIEFWATDIAKQMPNLAVMVAGGASGAGIAKTAFSKAVKRGMRKGLIKGTASVSGKFSATGLEAAGTGLAGRLTSATAKKVAGAVGGGLSMNMLNSAMIAGDAVNRAKNMGLSDEQAEWVGANTFLDNAKWVMADMVSWGWTFGGLNKGLVRGLKDIGSKTGLNFAEKIGRGGFRAVLKGGQKTSKVLGIASLEGMEEQFQEVYEEWVTQKNIAEASGKEFDDYWTFFNSPEMKKTRGIAFGAGLFGAAVPTMINEIAEGSRLWDNKEKYLKERFEKGDEAAAQRGIIQDMLASIVLNEQEIEFNSFLEDLVKREVITPEEKDGYIKEAEEFEQMYIKSQMKATDGSGRLNEKGAHFLYNMMVEQKKLENQLEEVKARGSEVLAAKLEGVTDLETMNRINDEFQDAHNEEVGIIEAQLESVKKMQENLVSGKLAEGVPDGYRLVGNRMVIDEESEYWENAPMPENKAQMEMDVMSRIDGLSEEQYAELTQEGSELNKENLKGKAERTAKKAAETGKSWFQKAQEKVKGMFGVKTEPTKQDEGEGEFQEFVKANNATEIQGDSFTDSDGTKYERTEGGFVRTSPDGKTQNISEKEAVAEYNRIGEEQMKRAEAKAEMNADGQFREVDDVAKVPKTFKVEDYTYRRNEDGSYSIDGSQTTVSAERAMEIYNGAVKTGNVENEMVGSFLAEVESIENDFKGTDERNIRGALKDIVSKLKEKYGDKWASVEGRVNDLIDEAVNALKGVGFDTVEGFRQRTQKRQAAYLAGQEDAEIEALKDMYTMSLNLNKYGGLQGLNNRAANLLPRYMGKNHSFIFQKGVQLNRQIKEKFGKGVNVVLLDNILHRTGNNAVAQALGSSVFISPNAFAQPEEFFHEMLHVHYAINPNDPAIKEMTNRALKNKPLMEKIRKDYADQVRYKITPTAVEIVEGPITTRVYKDGVNFKTAEGRVITPLSPEYYGIKAQFNTIEATAFELGVPSSAMRSNENMDVEELPIEQQDILQEEAYAHSMQSTVSEEFDLYFNPLDKRKNKSGAAKMWTKFRSRIDKKYAQQLGQEKFDEEARAEAIASLGQMDANSNWQIGGVRFMKPYSEAQQTEMQDSIEDGRMRERRAKTERKESELIDEGIINGETEEETEQGPNVGVNRHYAESKTAQRLINDFLKDFNQELNKNEDADRSRLVTKSDVVVPLRLWAKRFNRKEFALYARDNDYPPILELIAFLDRVNGEKYGEENAKAMTNAQLADIHKVYRTAVQEAPYQMLVTSKDGKLVVEHEALLNQSEMEHSDILENTYYKLAQAGFTFNKGIDRSIANEIRKDKAEEIIAKAKAWKENKNPTYLETLELFTLMFPSQELQHSGIMEEQLFYKGKSMPFMEAFSMFVNDTTKVKDRLYAYFKKSNEHVARPFIRSILAANRKHTLNDVVLNPEYNPTTTFNKLNYIKAQENNMNGWLNAMRNNNMKFGKAVSATVRMLGNHFLESGGVRFEPFAGIRNRAFEQNQKYSNINENAFAMSTLLRYLADPSDSYMQTLGTAADSNTHYTVRVPKISMNSPEAVELAQDVNKILGEEIFVIENGKISRSKGQFGQDLRKTLEFYQENMEDVGAFAELKLTMDRTNMTNINLRDAVFSNIVNKVGLKNTLFGEAATREDFTKRHKNANSPVTPYKEKTALDILAVNMPKLATVNETGKVITLQEAEKTLDVNEYTIVDMNDGDSWITPTGSERLKHEYGNSIDIKDAGAFKLMSYHNTRDHKGMEQLKTMTFVLSDELVRGNPILGAIRETLEAREKANSSNESYFAIAATTDALKQWNSDYNYDVTEGLNRVSAEGNNTTMQQELVREMTASMEGHNDIDGVFSGHISNTFGIQQEMDLGATRATMPTQLWANLLTNVDANTSQFDKVVDIQKKAAEIMAMNMEVEVLRQLKTNNVDARMEDLEKIASYVHKMYQDNDNVNALDKAMKGIKSLNIPYLNERAYNAIANSISRAGNKIIANGGYAFQTSEMGTVQVDAQNGVEFTTTLAEDEAIIPMHIAIKFGLKPGDKIMASRIPHHGLQTTRVFKVKDIFKGSNGSSIMVNSKFTNIIGADHDGDALFITARPTAKMFTDKKDSAWGRKKLHELTSLFNMIDDYLASPEVQEDVNAAMDPKKVLETAFEPGEFEKAKEDYLEGLSAATLWGEAKVYNENVPFKKMVGIAAQVHRIGNLLRAYKIDFNRPVKAGGEIETGFKNNGLKGENSTAFQSALLMNIILDNQSNQMGSVLGISPETINQYALMINMGFSFKAVKNFMKKPGVKAWAKVNGNRNNALFEEKGKSEMIDKAKALINSDKNLKRDEKESAYAQIEQMAYLDEMSNELLRLSTVLSGHKKLNGDYQILKKQLNDMKATFKSDEVFKNLHKLNDSPEVKRYKRTAEEMLRIHERTNIMAAPEIDKVYSKIVNATSESYLMGEKGRKIKNNVNRVLATELMYDRRPTREQYEQIPLVIQAAKTDPIIGENPFLKNLVLREGTLTMRPAYRNPDNLTPSDVNTMRYWYARLPKQVQRAIFHYDMIANGFAGPNSFVPYMSAPQMQALEKGANRMTLKHTRGQRMANTGSKIAVINSEAFPKYRMDQSPREAFSVSEKFFNDSRKPARLVLQNMPHFMTVEVTRQFGNKKVTEHIVHEYIPLMDDSFEQLKDESRNSNNYVDEKVLAQKLVGKGQYRRIGKRDLSDTKNLWLLDDTGGGNTPGGPTTLETALSGQKKNTSKARFLRSHSSDPKYINRLTYDEFITEHEVNDSAAAKNEYAKYLKNFAKYKKLADSEYSPARIGRISTEKLKEVYSSMINEPAEDVAPLMNEVTSEIFKRATREFMQANGITRWDTTHDISGMFKWLGAGNVSERNPTFRHCTISSLLNTLSWSEKWTRKCATSTKSRIILFTLS
jgi:hypothetical protein